MATITEDYVSFEIAKLLKEKGFDESIRCWYDNFQDFHEEGVRMCNTDCLPPTIMCPTLQMAMRWLRDVHHLVIQIELIDFLEHGEVWLYSIIERKTIKRLTDRDEDFTEHSYEEACEAAIKYCLENLI